MKELNQKLRRIWKGALRLLGGNWKALLLFVLFFSIANIMVSFTVYYLVIDIGMALYGVRYVDAEIFPVLIRQPANALLAVVGALFMAMISAFQVAGVIHIFRLSHAGKKATLGGAMSAGIRGCVRALLPQNWGAMLFLLVLVPAIKVITISSNYLEFYVPEFVMDYIEANRGLFALYCLVIVAAFAVLVLYLFSCNFFFESKESFIKACRRSRKLTQDRFILVSLVVLLTSALFFVVNVGASAVASEVYIKIASFFKHASETNVIYDNLLFANFSLTTRVVISEIIAPVVTLAVVTALYYLLLSEKASSADRAVERSVNEATNRVYVALSCFCLALCCVYYATNLWQSPDAFFQSAKRPEIVAHRGDSIRAPENTYPAFELAALENADGMIELDVQKTLDGVIVVSHDDSLKKFTGDDRAIHELTYAELQELDVGSWYSENYEGLRMSTLDEVLKLLKDYEDIRLQIEIKVAEYDHQLEEQLLRVIFANEMEDRCAIISLSPEPLRRIKALNPHVTTLYTMSMAIGDISAFELADGYSVEQSYITVSLVNKVHAAGKKIYAWTANTGSTIQYLVDCGVDGILTDDPIMLQEALDNTYYSGGFARIFRIYMDMLHNF